MTLYLRGDCYTSCAKHKGKGYCCGCPDCKYVPQDIPGVIYTGWSGRLDEDEINVSDLTKPTT